MKVAFPYMGNIYIPLRGILKSLGCEVVIPPKPNRQTVEIGARLSPELMCIPFKITLGNLINALELGADTIVHVGGSWSCRFGYYGRLHQNILRDLGYQFSAFILKRDELPFIYKKVRELNKGSFSRTLNKMVKAFWCGWFKSNLLELAETEARRLRPYELESGKADKLLDTYCQRIDQTFSLIELKKMKKEIISDFNTIQADFSRKLIRIKIVGESYCMVEPFVNFNLIAKLGTMRILVDPFLTTHRWLGFHSIRLGKNKTRMIRELARPYWKYCVGGEDENSIGHTILAAKQGFDGVIHLHPFACMPATVSQPVLTRISQEYNIPFLSLSLDEHTQEVGFYNRIEAFISLLERRRGQNCPLSTVDCFRADSQ
jgi:predicted nucleotide-binding protein (sugar kinase/HSP70/actin superfamily)